MEEDNIWDEKLSVVVGLRVVICDPLVGAAIIALSKPSKDPLSQLIGLFRDILAVSHAKEVVLRIAVSYLTRIAMLWLND